MDIKFSDLALVRSSLGGAKMEEKGGVELLHRKFIVGWNGDPFFVDTPSLQGDLIRALLS